jgi:hypothetical protein
MLGVEDPDEAVAAVTTPPSRASTPAAPTSAQVAAPATKKQHAKASVRGREVAPVERAQHPFDPPIFVQLSSIKVARNDTANSSESDVPTSAPPKDLEEMLAKLDNISAEVQQTELDTVALQTKVNTAESQIEQNAVSLEEAYQALAKMEGQKENNTHNINLMEESSGKIQGELEVQGGFLTNMTGEVGNLEVNVASIDPAASDLGTKAHEVADKVKAHIPALDNVTSRLDFVEAAITALEERMGSEGVVGPVKEDMDALVNGVSMQVNDLDDTVTKQGIPRRLIIKDPQKLLLGSGEFS